MRLISTEFPGLFIIEPRVFEDDRGFFMESYSQIIFEQHGLNYSFVQDNHAFSRSRGVLRGLHFQIPPYAQTKLVRVTRGAVCDVVVDLRSGSPTYGRWFMIELSARNFKQLLIPGGFAHGYMTLEENTDFLYKVDAPYAPEYERGIYYADPDLNIAWPIENPVLSEKDKHLPLFREFDNSFVLKRSDEERG